MKTVKCQRCGREFTASAKARAKYCAECRPIVRRQKGHEGDQRLLLREEIRSARAYLEARRRDFFAERDAVAACGPQCRVTVRMSNGVRIETRGTVGGGNCIGENRPNWNRPTVNMDLWRKMTRN